MYFATGKYAYRDNKFSPEGKNINGNKCEMFGKPVYKSFYDPTIADILNVFQVSWTFYSEGYDEILGPNQCYPYYYDAIDNPFTFFPSLVNGPNANLNFRDYTEMNMDIENEKLPAVSYVKFIGIHNEHPGLAGSLLSGQFYANNLVNKVLQSDYYKENTLIIVLPDESGGFYDHVKQPNPSTVDGQLYGPRTQFVAIGNMVKKNYISHVDMEVSSLIRFIEWNFIGKEGLLETRDKTANNIGDLIDEEIAGNVPIFNPLNYQKKYNDSKKKKRKLR